MKIYAPSITKGLARDSSEGEYHELFAPENKETLIKLSEDAQGNVKFGQKYLTSDVICVNLIGTVDVNTTARVLLPYPIVIPKLFTGSTGVAAMKPSSPKNVSILVGGVVKGVASIGVDGAITYTGPDLDTEVPAGAEISFKFDSLVNSGGGDIALSLYILK